MSGFRTQIPSGQLGDRDVREPDLAPEIGGGVALFSASPVTVGAAHYNLLDDTAGDMVVNLPDASTVPYAVFTFKKIVDSNNHIVITPNGTQKVEGFNDYAIRDFGDMIKIVNDGQDWFIVATTISKQRPPSGTPPIDPNDGDIYYDIVLKLLMYYDATRDKWLSIQAYDVIFQRKGNTQLDEYYDHANDRPMSPTYGVVLPINATIVGFMALRQDTDVADYIITEGGADRVTIPSTTTSTITTGLNTDIAANSILGVRNSNQNITTDVVGRVFIKFRK